MLEILATKFKLKLKFVTSNIRGRICWNFWLQNLNLNLNFYLPFYIFRGKLSYLGNIYKLLGVETAHTPFQALILKNKLYVNKTIHDKIKSIGKEKQQNFQFFCTRILTLLYKNPIRYDKYLQALKNQIFLFKKFTKSASANRNFGRISIL